MPHVFSAFTRTFRGRGLVTLLSLLLCAQPGFADYRDADKALKAKQYPEAAAQFEALMKLGHARATRQLAELVAKQRVESDHPAAALYRLAEALGDTKSARAAQRLERDMDEAQLALSRASAADLLARYGPEALRSSVLPASSGERPGAYMTRWVQGLEYPGEHFYSHGTVTVDFEFDVDSNGRPGAYELTREAPDGFVREAFLYFSSKRFPSLRDTFSNPQRIVFTRTNRDEQYGAAALLRKMRKRAEQGSPYRKYQYAFAQELSESLGNKYSDLDSNVWYLRSAQGGYAKAQYIVGQRLMFGWGFNREPDKALFWLRQAAQQGDKFANYYLGRMLLRDPDQQDQALAYLQRAAAAGHGAAAGYVAGED